MKKIIFILLSVTLFTNIGFCDKPFFDAFHKYKRIETLLTKDGTIKDVVFYKQLKQFGKRYRPSQNPNKMVEYWIAFIDMCQERGYYEKLFYYNNPTYDYGPTAGIPEQNELSGLIRDLNKVFKKLNPGVTQFYDNFNVKFSIKKCECNKDNPTYREYGDKSTDGTGRETDTFYCTFLN